MNVLFPANLLPFSESGDEAGYDDHPISNDVINEIYAEFSQRTRHEESDKYLWTLTGTSVLIVQISVSTKLGDASSYRSFNRRDLQSDQKSDVSHEG